MTVELEYAEVAAIVDAVKWAVAKQSYLSRAWRDPIARQGHALRQQQAEAVLARLEGILRASWSPPAREGASGQQRGVMADLARENALVAAVARLRAEVARLTRANEEVQAGKDGWFAAHQRAEMRAADSEWEAQNARAYTWWCWEDRIEERDALRTLAARLVGALCLYMRRHSHPAVASCVCDDEAQAVLAAAEKLLADVAKPQP